MRPVIKPKNYRDLGSFDVAELSALAKILPDSLWEIEDERKDNKFSVFHHTQHIIFRFSPGNLDPLNYYSKPIWDVWRNKLLPLMDAITDQYAHTDRRYSKVMLARLLAGSQIDMHYDGAGSNLLTHKVHVPLQTNPDALLIVEDSERHLEIGCAVEINNIARHAAVNNGKVHRIHLIFEHFDAAS